MELRNRFQGMNSACLCSLEGRYDNPIPTRFLALRLFKNSSSENLTSKLFLSSAIVQWYWKLENCILQETNLLLFQISWRTEKGALESISLTGRNDNSFWRTGPPGNICWRSRFLGSINAYKFGLGIDTSVSSVGNLSSAYEGQEPSRHGVVVPARHPM